MADLYNRRHEESRASGRKPWRQLAWPIQDEKVLKEQETESVEEFQNQGLEAVSWCDSPGNGKEAAWLKNIFKLQL